MSERTYEQRLLLFDTSMRDIIDEDFRQYLIDNGFFTAPASTKFHGAYEGGLFDHSFNVAMALLGLTIKLKLTWSRFESPLIVGMFHDLCKIDQYLFNTETKTYIWNSRQRLLGHGDKSVKLLLEHMKLTQEEINCIEQHMGSFTDKENWPRYTNAIHSYSNVLYTHMADMIASHIVEVDKQRLKE